MPPEKQQNTDETRTVPPLQEIAEPLFDLKLGMEQLASNQTFRRILATLLAIGNFLNSTSVSPPAVLRINQVSFDIFIFL